CAVTLVQLLPIHRRSFNHKHVEAGCPEDARQPGDPGLRAGRARALGRGAATRASSIWHCALSLPNWKVKKPHSIEFSGSQWTSDVESTAPLDVLLRHDLWTPFWCLMSFKVRSIISVACDFTTKSDGIWQFLDLHYL